jgi:hypothetical protein
VPEVGVPIAEKIAYVTNEELSNMYIELLANASQVAKANVAHPSFVNVINNISPDEAIILQSLKAIDAFPFIEVRKTNRIKGSWITLNPVLAGIGCLDKLQYPKNINAYVSNLQGLGVLTVQTDRILADMNLYESLIETAKAQYKLHEVEESEFELTWEQGQVETTPFAHLLLNACFSSSV